MDDLTATDTISKGIGDNMNKGHNVRHERGTKKRKDGGHSRIQRDSGETP